MSTTDAVQKATGRTRKQWFAALDKWGAEGRPYREIAQWLTDKHGVSRWWAQKLIVEYEQERGVRKPGVRRDGTFGVTASKTVNVPISDLFVAFTDSRRRKKWLGDAELKLRTSRKPKAARFDWDGGPSRLSVTFEPKGRTKALVAVSHDHLKSSRDAEKAKAMWRARLSDLKSLLEA